MYTYESTGKMESSYYETQTNIPPYTHRIGDHSVIVATVLLDRRSNCQDLNIKRYENGLILQRRIEEGYFNLTISFVYPENIQLFTYLFTEDEENRIDEPGLYGEAIKIFKKIDPPKRLLSGVCIKKSFSYKLWRCDTELRKHSNAQALYKLSAGRGAVVSNECQSMEVFSHLIWTQWIAFRDRRHCT